MALMDCDPAKKDSDSEKEEGLKWEIFDEIAANNDSIPDRIEQLREYDRDSLQCLEALSENGKLSDYYVAAGLTGNEMPEAYEKRNGLMEKVRQLKEINGEKDDKAAELMRNIGLGLAGCLSKEADAMRQEMLRQGHNQAVMVSLAGVEGPAADDLRDRLLKQRWGSAQMNESLFGVESDASMNLREKLLKNKICSVDEILETLAGLKSERANKMRLELEKKAGKGAILRSLSGDTSPESYERRRRLMEAPLKKDEYGPRARDLMTSLAGDESIQAWKMREEVWNDGKGMMDVTESLVGINSARAWEMRKAMVLEGRGDWVVESLAAGTILSGSEILPLIKKSRELAAANKTEAEVQAENVQNLAAKKEEAVQSQQVQAKSIWKKLLGR